MKKNHAGFGIIAVLIIILIVALLGSAGWFVISRHNTATQPNNQQNNSSPIRKSASDTAKTFTYSYPTNWTIQKYVWEDCCEGPAHPEPDWTKQPQPITLKENHTTADAAIHIDADMSGTTTVDSMYSSRTIDQFNTYTKLKINGYDSLYHVTDFVGPASAEKYKDYEYLVTHNNEAVDFKFRERYSNRTNNGTGNFDAAKLTPEFRSIVMSIHFLK